MADDHTGRWRRTQRTTDVTDPLQTLRLAILEVRNAPRDPEARRQLRARAAEQGAWEQLAMLLGDEARAAESDEIAAAFYEELADIHENLDQPLEMIAAMEHVVRHEPDDVEQHDRLAWLYRRAGAWQKAAEMFERVAQLAIDDRARAALHAAGRLYRDHGQHERAVAVYRAIVLRRASDVDAWRALEELYAALGEHRELAVVRGELAARAADGIEKALLLRAQARALEDAGDPRAAAALVARAAEHAPDDVSGLVDYAQVLARDGRSGDAADVLAARVAQAVERGASVDEIAALRYRLAVLLEDSCGDRPGAARVLAELLQDAPDHLPALQRAMRHAEASGDPRAAADAIARYAEALPADDEAAAMHVTAARRWRELGDHRAAVRGYERAIELGAAEAELAAELETERTAIVVERARDEATKGNPTAAEQRLRTILATRPTNVPAVLALADVLAERERLDAAAEHLHTTLAAHSDAMPPEQVARIVHRYATVMTALGDADEAHQLLHEAHRLARKDLSITLALGESCFQRRLWREAALYLGSLAEHPAAREHAAAVALGLVHAAQAEVRALRPANASKHYDAAVKIDPDCARAWHALGQIASERGDTVRYAECLQREAAASGDPKLYDQLGDLALEQLGDAKRAEAAWSAISATAPAALLDKLLALQRRRGAGIERAETCTRLAELVADPKRKKELAEEAAEAFAAGGDLARAREAATRLVAAHPLDVDAVACASAIAIAARDFEHAATWLRKALAAWDAAGDRGEDDPRRADLWRRFGDATYARGEHHAAKTAYERAVELAPDSDAAHAGRRGLVELARTAGRPAGEVLAALVEAERDPADVLAWARELAASERFDDARAAFELAKALGATLSASDDELFAKYRPRALASDEAYGAVLDATERAQLIDDPHDPPLGDLLDLLGEAAPLVCPDAKAALARAGLPTARRLSGASEAAVAALFPPIARTLGAPATLLYASTDPADSDRLGVLFSAPPIVVIGPALATIRPRTQVDPEAATDLELRFRLGRVAEIVRARRLFAITASAETFASLVAALRHAFDPKSASPDPAVAREGERLRTALPVPLRRRITERLASASQLDTARYLAACERAADRAGLLACGDVAVAVAAAGGPGKARHLVELAATPRYLAVRKKLRPRRA